MDRSCETNVSAMFNSIVKCSHLLDFVPISEEEKEDSCLEIIGFRWSHATEGRQQRVMESGYWSSMYWGYDEVERC